MQEQLARSKCKLKRSPDKTTKPIIPIESVSPVSNVATAKKNRNQSWPLRDVGPKGREGGWRSPAPSYCWHIDREENGEGRPRVRDLMHHPTLRAMPQQILLTTFLSHFFLSANYLNMAIYVCQAFTTLRLFFTLGSKIKLSLSRPWLGSDQFSVRPQTIFN